MKQTIILSNNLDGADYLKTVAKLSNNSINTFGVRVMNSLELAKYVLQLSGITIEKEFVNDNTLAAELYLEAKKIDYFKDSSYEDIYNLLKSINELRRCIPFNEQSEIESKLPLDQFKKKNEAVKEFYHLLIDMLDTAEQIDEISIIRLAIEQGKPIENIDFVMYEEFIYNNLDIALINHAAGKEIKPIRLSDVNKPLNISSYTKSFGQNNEIEAVLSYIYKNNIKFDECLIVAPNVNEYGKILSNYQASIGFPLIIGSSQSINDTSSGRLFSMFLDWADHHFHKDFLIKILNSREFNLEQFKKDIELPDSFDEKNNELGLTYYDRISFDMIIDVVGNLKIGFQGYSKDIDVFTKYEKLIHQRLFDNSNDIIVKRDLYIYEFVTKIKGVFDHSLKSLIGRYTLLDEDNISVERNALDKIVLVLSYQQYFGVPIIDLIKFLKGVLVGNRKTKPGYLYITSINNAISSLRKHLFIVGLDSKSFPGKVKEDPIIFDRDYEKFGILNASSRDIEKNKNDYHALIDVANTFGVDIHLSYSYYNSETIKEQSASSVVFETYQKENSGRTVTVADFNNEFGSNGKFKSVEFFDESLFPLSHLGEALKNNTIVTPIDIKESDTSNVDATTLLSSRGLSASAINQFVECEYKFFLATLLHIQQEKDTNIYEIMPANDFGTLAHSLMEQFDPHMSKNDFLDIANNLFDEYMILHPSEDVAGVNNMKQEFLLCASNGYDMELFHNSPSVLREEDVTCVHQPSGLKIHGFPDKVEKLNDGTYRVVDYKTGEKIKHSANDLDSVLQGAHYAYILEHDKKLKAKLGNNVKVSEFTFRYLKSKEEISSYDNNHTIKDYLDNLDNRLKAIADAIKAGKFNKTGDCKSCYYKSVCSGKEDK